MSNYLIIFAPMASIKHWITAARLRTLPLAFACIITGTAAALNEGLFNPYILALALFTTLCFQVLSNFANDYGDALSGKDNEGRIGPDRMVSSGAISAPSMKKALIITSIISFLAGLSLSMLAFENWKLVLLFTLLGVASIVAAIKYTVGKNPYGYAGLGDLFVFLFFGILGVLGSYMLYSNHFNWLVLLPSFSMGCLSVAVLNANNMRDIVNDKETGKNTLAVKLGFEIAKTYQSLMLIGGFAGLIVYGMINSFELNQYLFLLAAPFFLLILKKTLRIIDPADMDPYLKRIALGTFVLSLLFLTSVLLG